MEKPLVTVLMPVYNGEKYIREAIDSILDQTLTNFEFLIIDDGSKDSSVDIILSYSDPRIRFVKNDTNLGISKTLNKGIEIAAAELIARMDADDISYPARLQKQYDHFISNPECALLSTWARTITEDGEHVKTEKYKSRLHYYNLTFECWMYHPTVMYTRTAVMEVGMYNIPYAEDFELFWQLSRKFKIACIEEVLIDYRITGQSLHQVIRKKEYDETMDWQLIRNIHYYTGDTFKIDWEEVECLRFNFIPIMNKKNVDALVKCLNKLDYINQCILNTPNINYNRKNLEEAIFYKKEFIIRYFKRNLIEKDVALLYSRLSMQKHFWKMVKIYSARRLRRFLRSFK
ncbi:MAG TPA: glycosyltransferase [Flavitalea sp.]|nr:glycosyltransferase [Flavitalea sp.]